MDGIELFHTLPSGVDTQHMRLNNPFDYLPHPAVCAAAQQIEAYLADLSTGDGDDALRSDLARGKMLGVLVARSESGEVGFFAGFSGSIGGCTRLSGFVPPIYDIDCEDGYFRAEEARISAIGEEIDEVGNSSKYIDLKERLRCVEADGERVISESKATYAEGRVYRAELRKTCEDADELARIEREGQFQRGELRRVERRVKESIDSVRRDLEVVEARISTLKESRHTMSIALQERLFDSYRILNGAGEWRSVRRIFKEYMDTLPPAGAGECAAPKLFQYALVNGYEPLAIGEFWHGASPRSEVRHAGEFYGACRGKCKPILSFVLEGLDVDMCESQASRSLIDSLELIAEDDYIVIFNKPSGMLSVEGRDSQPSLESVAKSRYPEAMMVHRLDQGTSGVIVVAKGFDVYRALQRQFSERTLSKRYVAIVEGMLRGKKSGEGRGEIKLPIRPNPLDRPRQVVDHIDGKEAHTTYEVLGYTDEGNTRLALYPHTGRTHQLRLHAAHVEGLNSPILGDRLYGRGKKTAHRLYLHAESITFTHPITGERVTYTAPTSL